jgi:hypothetical protein
MTRNCSLVIEGLPTILVTGRSEERTTRAAEAIRLYCESVPGAEALDC